LTEVSDVQAFLATWEDESSRIAFRRVLCTGIASSINGVEVEHCSVHKVAPGSRHLLALSRELSDVGSVVIDYIISMPRTHAFASGLTAEHIAVSANASLAGSLTQVLLTSADMFGLELNITVLSATASIPQESFVVHEGWRTSTTTGFTTKTTLPPLLDFSLPVPESAATLSFGASLACLVCMCCMCLCGVRKLYGHGLAPRGVQDQALVPKAQGGKKQSSHTIEQGQRKLGFCLEVSEEVEISLGCMEGLRHSAGVEQAKAWSIVSQSVSSNMSPSSSPMRSLSPRSVGSVEPVDRATMSSDQVAASSDSSSMATDEWSGSLTVPTPSRAPTVAAQRLKDVIPPLKLAGLQHGPPLRHTSSNGGGGSSRSSSSVAPFAQSHLPNLHSSVLLTPVSLGVSSHSAAPCGQLQLTGSHSGPLLPPALLGSGDDGIGSNNIATPRAQLQLASLPREPVARHASSQSSVSLRSGGSGGPSTQVQLASLEHRSLVSQASPSSGASGGNHRATLPMHLPLASSPDPAPVRQAFAIEQRRQQQRQQCRQWHPLHTDAGFLRRQQHPHASKT